MLLLFFFFNDTATTEIYTLSLHDALPIYLRFRHRREELGPRDAPRPLLSQLGAILAQVGDKLAQQRRSEEHTSELQSQSNLVCRLLLEKKKDNYTQSYAEVLRRLRALPHA